MKRLAKWAVATGAVLASTLGLAGVAVALSCVPPSIGGSFQNYVDAPELYVVYSGTWQPMQPVPSTSGGGPLPPVRYQFTGRQVGAGGATGSPRRLDVVVQPQCAGSWCGDYPSAGENALAFIEDRGRGSRPRYVFEEGPCGGAQFANTRANVRQMASCMAGRSCPGSGGVVPPPPAPPADQCGATGPLSNYIGRRVESLPVDDLPRFVRFIRPGDAVTMDLNPSRLNVDLDRFAIIQGMRCG